MAVSNLVGLALVDAEIDARRQQDAEWYPHHRHGLVRHLRQSERDLEQGVGFLAFGEYPMIEEAPERMQEAFANIDTNADGFIDSDEFEARRARRRAQRQNEQDDEDEAADDRPQRPPLEDAYQDDVNDAAQPDAAQPDSSPEDAPTEGAPSRNQEASEDTDDETNQ